MEKLLSTVEFAEDAQAIRAAIDADPNEWSIWTHLIQDYGVCFAEGHFCHVGDVEHAMDFCLAQGYVSQAIRAGYNKI